MMIDIQRKWKRNQMQLKESYLERSLDREKFKIFDYFKL